SSGFRSKSFNSQWETKTNGYSKAITVADLNGDGKVEIISAYYDTQEIQILSNKSSIDSIKIDTIIRYGAGTAPSDVKTGDLDGDGLLDIVISDEKDNNLTIYKNTSSGSSVNLATKQILSLNTGTLSFCIADINLDGRPDIIGISSSGFVYIYKNISLNGNIQFSQETGLNPPGGGFLSFVAAADIDGDGKAEIAAINRVNYNITIWKNSSTINSINFTTTTVQPLPGRPGTLALGDINGDNLIDFVISNTDNNNVMVIRNKSVVGTIAVESNSSQFAASRFPETVLIQDFDGDGKADIAVANLNASSFSVLKNLQNTGDSISFAARVDYMLTNAPGDGIRYITTSDVNNDGFPDIIASYSFNNKLCIFRNSLLQPIIQSLTPSLAKVGSALNIKGKNFIQGTEVSINSKKILNSSIISDSLITGTLPSSFSGYMIAKNTYGEDSAVFNYVIPSIDSISPKKGKPGIAITIYGKNFDSIAPKTIFFGAVQAKVQGATSNRITAVAPAAATYENITLTENGTTIYSNIPFIS
ncbi:MAG: hypothetical protein FGM61_11960, partial [Sediminibacterium sp.]|nr:hypothetical protein [Sediminibacterium sp.]